MNVPAANISNRDTTPDCRISENIGAQSYRCGRLSHTARVLLDAHEYISLLDVLNRELSDSETRRLRGVRILLRHSAARFNLNFERAAVTIQDALRKDALPSRLAESYGRTAKHGAFSLQRLRELLWTARIFLERGDFGNFVVRTAMLLETTRRQLVYLLIGLKAATPLISSNRLDPELNQTLETAGMYKRDGEWSNTKRFMKVCIEWGSQQLNDEAATKAAANLQSGMGDLKLLEELRNDFVHQARGIARSDLENQWGSVSGLETTLTNLLEKMKTLHRELGGRAESVANVYTDLNRTVLELLHTENAAR